MPAMIAAIITIAAITAITIPWIETFAGADSNVIYPYLRKQLVNMFLCQIHVCLVRQIVAWWKQSLDWDVCFLWMLCGIVHWPPLWVSRSTSWKALCCCWWWYFAIEYMHVLIQWCSFVLMCWEKEQKIKRTSRLHNDMSCLLWLKWA